MGKNMMRGVIALILTALLAVSFIACGSGGGSGSDSTGNYSNDGSDGNDGNTNDNANSGSEWVIQKIVVTDGGQTLSTTTYSYDSKGNQISASMSSSSLNISITNTFNSEGQMTISVTNDHTWNTTSTTDYTYDTNGDAIRLDRTDTGGGTTYTTTTYIEYDVYHNPTKHESFSGGVSQGVTTWVYTYTDEGKISNVKNYASGTYISNIDYAYDSNGYLITMTNTFFLGGTQSTSTTTFTYDENGNTATSKSSESSAITTYIWIEI